MPSRLVSIAAGGLIFILIFAFSFLAGNQKVTAATCAENTSLNLLQNGIMDGVDGPGTAYNWTAFTVSGQPNFEHVSNEGWDPGGSQMIYQYDNGGNPNALFDAGVFQTVPGLSPGSVYHAWFIWGQTQHDVNGYLTPGTMIRQIGVDPYGGTNPDSSTVVWSVPYQGSSGFARSEWNLYFQAQTSHATVFVRAKNLDPTYGNKVFFDTICLYSASGSFTSTPWATTGNTPTKTATPSATQVGNTPTATRTPTSTPTPTRTPALVGSGACSFAQIGLVGPVAGASPKGIVVNPTANRVYVALFNPSAVASINPNDLTYSVLPSALVSGHANGVAVQNGKLFVTMRDAGQVAVMNEINGAEDTPIPVGVHPYGIGASNGRVWVANYDSGNDTVINALNNSVVSTSDGGIYPALVATLNDRAFITFYGGGILVLDSNGKSIDVLTIGDGAYGVAVDPVRNRVYATTRTTGKILVFDATTLALLNSVTPSNTPYGIAVNPETNHLWVVFANVNQIGIYDGTSLSLISTLAARAQGTEGGDGIAILNDRVYVSNNADDSLSVFSDSCDRRKYIPAILDAHP